MRDYEITFVVPGNPHGKERARTYWDRSRRRYATYTPKGTVEYERSIRTAYKAAGGRFLGSRPVFMDIELGYRVPKSAAKLRTQMLSGQIVPTTKPDIDNVVKSVQDALNLTAYSDDACVVGCIVRKAYAEDPQTRVTLWTDTDIVSAAEWKTAT